jgi:fatty acid desaturase
MTRQSSEIWQQDRKRSLAANAAQVTLIATFVALCYLLINFGHWGLYALPILYTALLVFYDVRPDLAQRIFPELWRER